jgi:putative transposase
MDEIPINVKFLLMQERDEPVAEQFLTRASRRHGVPEKITIDGSEANAMVNHSYNAEHGTWIAICHMKYLNNSVEQDHRAVKRVTHCNIGLKHFVSAQTTLAGIELVHMLRMGQIECEGVEGRTPAEQFYALAA